MKNFVNGFITCIGAISSVLALADAFPMYQDVFLVLIGICVGFWLGSINQRPSKKSTDAKASPGFFLLSVPVLLLLSTIAVLHCIGVLTESVLMMVLIFGGLIVFLSTMPAIALILSESENRKDGTESDHKNKPSNHT